MIGADIEALYPSLDPTRTGEAIRLETIRSEVKWVGVDWAEALKYLKINLTPYKAKQLEVEHLLPERKFSKGPSPGITSENALSADREHEDRWVQKIRVDMLTDTEKARIMGCCIEIAVVVLFTKHCYKFGAHTYLQIGGGPTGLSSTGSSADVRVTAWATKLMEIFKMNNITEEELFAYVDDLRLALEALLEGTMFCTMCKYFYHNTEQETLDKASGETDTQRTARLMLQVFNSIEPDLKFTVETEYDFPDRMLPTLDTKLQVVERELDSGEQAGLSPKGIDSMETTIHQPQSPTAQEVQNGEVTEPTPKEIDTTRERGQHQPQTPTTPTTPPTIPQRRDPEYLGKGLESGGPGNTLGSPPRLQPGPPQFPPPPPPLLPPPVGWVTHNTPSPTGEQVDNSEEETQRNPQEPVDEQQAFSEVETLRNPTERKSIKVKQISYSFYSKPLASMYVILENSAASY